MEISATIITYIHIRTILQEKNGLLILLLLFTISVLPIFVYDCHKDAQLFFEMDDIPNSDVFALVRCVTVSDTDLHVYEPMVTAANKDDYFAVDMMPKTIQMKKTSGLESCGLQIWLLC